MTATNHTNHVTIDEALRQSAKRLSLYSSTPRLDVEVLLAHVLETDRAMLLAHYQDPISAQYHARFEELVERRAKGEPVAYLTGHKEFYGLDLYITPDVLVPRPETESLVDVCLRILDDSDFSQLADTGTGSGAILVAVLKNRTNVRGFGTEISPKALEVARTNLERHGLADHAKLYVGHLLEPLESKMNVIVANLPYVPPGEASPEVATWEPNVAVFGGGEDGTALIREFLAAAPDYLLPGGAVVMEVAYSQGQLVTGLANQAFPGAVVDVRKDLAGYDRIVVVRT